MMIVLIVLDGGRSKWKGELMNSTKTCSDIAFGEKRPLKNDFREKNQAL